MDGSLVVISLGGSIIVPDEVNVGFLQDFATRVRTHIAAGKRFIIIAGGGKTSRKYQDAARTLGELSNNDLDWLGIHATRLNGHLLRSIFRAEAHPRLIDDPTDPLVEADVIIAAGWQPGWSTDYVAVKLAANTRAKKLINLSNVDFVYSADPKKAPGAKPLEKISWADFRNMLPATWDPGLSAPFDPVAAAEAETLGLEVAVMGSALNEFDAYLSGKPFKGTLISD